MSTCGTKLPVTSGPVTVTSRPGCARIFGRWLKPSKNEIDHSTGVPFRPQRNPICESSGNTLPASTRKTGSSGTGAQRWSNNGMRLGVKRGSHTTSNVSCIPA